MLHSTQCTQVKQAARQQAGAQSASEVQMDSPVAGQAQALETCGLLSSAGHSPGPAGRRSTCGKPAGSRKGREGGLRMGDSKEHAAGTWSNGPPEARAAKQTELRERRCMHPGQGLHVRGQPAAGGTWPKRTCHRRRRSRGRSRCKPRGQANGQPGRRVNSQQRG